MKEAHKQTIVIRDEPTRSTPCEELADRVKAEDIDKHIDMLLKQTRGGRPCDGCLD